MRNFFVSLGIKNSLPKGISLEISSDAADSIGLYKPCV